MPDTPSPARPVTDEDLLAGAIPIEHDDESHEADDLAPIEIDDGPVSENMASKISVFGQRKPHEDHWNRKPNVTGAGAIHVKTFVAKLRYDAIEHLDEQVNQWLDNHPEYEVKFVTTTVGELRGKLLEPALFMNVWV